MNITELIIPRSFEQFSIIKGGMMILGVTVYKKIENIIIKRQY